MSKNQYGFRKGKSTEDAIRKLVERIYQWMDGNKVGLCVFIDLAKAFDTVSHAKLLRKLHVYGFRGKAFELMKSYLANRIQFVKMDEHASEKRTVEYGVPQGTVLGPVLFLIYMNSLLLAKRKGKIISFADDTVILYEDSNWRDLKQQAEGDLSVIKEWFRGNKLTLNLQKTKYLPFAAYESGLPHMGNLEFEDGTSIPEAEHIKYLGITIDRHLKWNKHIDILVAKLRCLLTKFKHLKKHLDVPNLMMVYAALCQSLIRYGIIGWGGAYSCHMRRVEVVQKWLLRIIYGKPLLYPTDDLFAVSRVMNPHQLFALQILIGISDQKIILKLSESQHETRNRENQYLTLRAGKRIGQRSFAYLAPRIYAAVPRDLKSARTSIAQRKKLKNWVIDRGRKFFNNIINPQ